MQWLDRLSDVLTRDEEFAIVARFFTANVLFQSGAARRLVCVREGKMTQQLDQPGFDAPWDFVLRAPDEVWERFTRVPPPPCYTDIWAMRMRVPEFVWEGNTLLAAQNARALTRMTELLRHSRQATGASDGT